MKAEELLKSMFPHPRHVRALVRGRRVVDHLEDVTIMFSDLKGYTQWASEESPREVYRVLNKACIYSRVVCVSRCWMVQSEMIAELVGKVKRVGLRPCTSLAGTVRQRALDEKQEKKKCSKEATRKQSTKTAIIVTSKRLGNRTSGAGGDKGSNNSGIFRAWNYSVAPGEM